MAEPGDFGNSSNPSAKTTTVTKVHYDYGFGDLQAGSTLELKLTVGGVSQTKTLTVPANKTFVQGVLNLDGFLT